MAEFREPIPLTDEAVLIENHEELIRQLTPKDIINSLFQRRMIDLDDMNDIRQEERRNGRRAGVEKLLERIHRSGPDGLVKFIDSLNASGYASLSIKLQESRDTKTNRTDEEKTNQPSRSERNDVPQSGHKEILRKNYLIIMDNIRVTDILDHLFSKEVIEENDMDVIKTKLKSEGNREAMRCLMDILLRFSHKSLPKFIHCLNKTGYDHIAKRLQDEMSHVNPS